MPIVHRVGLGLVTLGVVILLGIGNAFAQCTPEENCLGCFTEMGRQSCLRGALMEQRLRDMHRRDCDRCRRQPQYTAEAYSYCRMECMRANGWGYSIHPPSR